MWSNLILAASLVFLSSISQLDTSGDKKLLQSSVPNSLELLKEEFTPQLQTNYAKSNEFFSRWLKAHDYNIAKTRQGLSEFVNWRKNHVSNRGRRDLWAAENIPIPIIQDKLGAPVFYHDISKYNLRKLSEENKLEEFPLTIMRTLDSTCENIFSSQQSGKNVSLIGVLVNWTGFNARDQLCPHCVSGYVDIIKYYEANYPLTVSRVIHINTPELFIPVANVMKKFMSDELRESFIMFSRDDKESAKRYLDSWLGKSNTFL